MRNRLIKAFLMVLLAVVMSLGSVTVFFGENITSDQYAPTSDLMAHIIYSKPVLSDTSGNFNTYIIDFWGEQVPDVTNWSFASFNMSISFKSGLTYKEIHGGGAHTGFQVRDKTSASDAKTIMISMWEYKYKDNGEEKTLNPSRIYPNGSSDFGNGDNAYWIGYHDWKDRSWYRLALHCWEDEETGMTFVGEWVCDLSTGEWFLNAYFNTKLYNAKITGDLGFFQENYVGGLANWSQEREYRIKNMYVNDAADGLWKSITSADVFWSKGQKDYVGRLYNRMGGFDFGTGSDADGEYFWGKAGGYVPGQDPNNYDREEYVKVQRAYEATKTQNQKFTISQPDQPTNGNVAIESVNISKAENGNWSADWALAKTSTPQLSYKLQMIDQDGKELFSKYETRPHINKLEIGAIDAEEVKCVLTVTDIYGSSTTYETASEGYGKSEPITKDNVSVEKSEDSFTINWSNSAAATEEKPYKVEIIDEQGNVVFTKTVTEGKSCQVTGVTVDEYKYRITTVDENGAEVVVENTTENYQLSAPATTAPATEDEDDSGNNSGLIIGIVVAVVVVLGGAVVFVFLKKKK